MDCAWCHSIPCECKAGEGRKALFSKPAEVSEKGYRAAIESLRKDLGKYSIANYVVHNALKAYEDALETEKHNAP